MLTRTTYLKPGKKTREWTNVRRELSKYFNFAGITRCELRLEGCWGETALSFSHCRKRRKLLEGEIWHVALLCNPCHAQLELLPPEEMHKIIHEIIDRRGLLGPARVLREIAA